MKRKQYMSLLFQVQKKSIKDLRQFKKKKKQNRVIVVNMELIEHLKSNYRRNTRRSDKWFCFVGIRIKN